MVEFGKKNDAVFFRTEYKKNKSWEWRVLITSDIHLDSKKCDLDFLKYLLKEMKEDPEALWIDNGDLFDCMGGKYDRRSNKSDIRPELQTANYFDSLIDFAAEHLGPYADKLAVMTYGNHELSVQARQEIDLIQRLRYALGKEHNCMAEIQKYSGFVRFFFYAKDPKENEYARKSFTMYKTHGTGGAAPVTLGTIQTSRRQEMIDADIFVSGHIHNDFVVTRPKWRLNADCSVVIDEPVHIQIGTFKDSTKSTWEQMKGFRPPALSAYWLKFKYCPRTRTLKVTPERAN